MKPSRLFVALIAGAQFFAQPGFGAGHPDYKTIAPNIAELLEKAHYSRRKLDDTVSKDLLKNYIDALDYNRLFFTQKDVDNLTATYATKLDDDLLLGNTESALKIFHLYRKRVQDRVEKIKVLLESDYKFDSDKTVELNRQKAEWAKDEKEADQLWRDRLEGDLLDRTLMNSKLETPVKILTRRYNQVLRNLKDQDEDDVVSTFLSVLSQTYDPHSEYMSKAQLESFSINMRLSLVGIGAVLTSEEGYAKIRELMPGGPAAEDGRLKVGDRICGVAQGDEEFVDTMDMKLDKVVEMIRGKKDTVVRLQVLSATATDPSMRKIIDLNRREVKLKEQEAKAQLVERPMPDGTVQKIGWITLPSFYADMEKSGLKNAKSTTKDVLTLLERLKKENIDGLVVDLRRNGGGSLEEVVNLTGLFIKSGPVVVARDSNGRSSILKDRDKAVTYDGPMVVLCNRLSASASEIFAAALQDYNRAIIVGDSSTFGKGTVQTMVDIGRILPIVVGGSNDAGALKLTIQKFYRIAGGATQLKGVSSDIRLPSIYDQTEIGESSLKGPMPYDTIEPVPFTKLDQPLFKDHLLARSGERVAASQEFQWIQEDLERSKKRLAENKISLNEKLRRAELDDAKERKKKRDDERAKKTPVDEKLYDITLDNAASPTLELAVEKKNPHDDIVHKPKPEGSSEKEPEATPAPDKKDATSPDEKSTTPADGKKEGEEEEEEEEDPATKSPRFDPLRNEAINILKDLIEFTKTPPPAGEVKVGETAAVK